MNKLILILLLSYSNIILAQNDIPQTNLKIIDFFDSIRVNNIYDEPNLIEKALIYANAKQADGYSYGQEYSDLHEILPGDIYFIENYYEFEELPQDCPKQQRRVQNDINKVDFITIQQYKLIQISLNSQENKEENEILKMLFGIDNFDNDKLHFYHPQSLN